MKVCSKQAMVAVDGTVRATLTFSGVSARLLGFSASAGVGAVVPVAKRT